ncbi:MULTISPECIES: DUF2500 domain-containing protein [unclassified Streptococcus]|uniref:DUF2500 domain-containing protein n=1 Tax=unclassified Streptococcus TaxID=2608887 RepID=UPI00359E1460
MTDFIFYYFHLVPFSIFAIILAIFGFQLIRFLFQWQSDNQVERLTRGARLVTKRQQVRGTNNAYTYYYVTFEFADKTRQEFRVKSTDYGQLAEGDEGELTYQGTRFVAFKRI